MARADPEGAAGVTAGSLAGATACGGEGGSKPVQSRRARRRHAVAREQGGGVTGVRVTGQAEGGSLLAGEGTARRWRVGERRSVSRLVSGEAVRSDRGDVIPREASHSHGRRMCRSREAPQRSQAVVRIHPGYEHPAAPLDRDEVQVVVHAEEAHAAEVVRLVLDAMEVLHDQIRNAWRRWSGRGSCRQRNEAAGTSRNLHRLEGPAPVEGAELVESSARVEERLLQVTVSEVDRDELQVERAAKDEDRA